MSSSQGPKSLVAGVVLGASAIVAAPLAHADTSIHVKGLEIVAKPGTNVVAMNDNWRVTGPAPDITVMLAGAITAGKTKSVVTSVALDIQHVDKRAHSFSLDFGPKIGTVSFTCNEREGSFKLSFAGAKTYALMATQAGKVVQTRKGVAPTDAVTIAGFDTVHNGQTETVSVRCGWTWTDGGHTTGASKGVFQVTLTHDNWTVVLAPEGVTWTLADVAPVEVGLKTTGLDEGFQVTHSVQTTAL
jgi:uncharacterized membrane protein (UPF0136 family)